MIIGLHHFTRMYRKSHDRRSKPTPGSYRTHLLYQVAVSPMYSVKETDSGYTWTGTNVRCFTKQLHVSNPREPLAYAIAASAKTIAFGDFSYYWIADRQGRSFKRLNELFATTGQVGFMATQRVDGKLILSEAIKVLAQKASA